VHDNKNAEDFNYLIYNLLILSVYNEDYCTNAYVLCMFLWLLVLLILKELFQLVAFDFELSLFIFSLIFTYYLVRIVYVVVTWITIRLHQSKLCHFAISFLSFFSIYGFWPPLWYLQPLPTYQAKDLLAEPCVTLDRLDYPHLFLIPRISIIWFTIFWFWVYIMKIIAQTLMCCVCFCDCSFCYLV
jgi:hypothetical protein